MSGVRATGLEVGTGGGGAAEALVFCTAQPVARPARAVRVAVSMNCLRCVCVSLIRAAVSLRHVGVFSQYATKFW